MSRTTITEACGCGASVTVVAGYSDQARRAAAEWREGHRHAESVGICGDALPVIAGLEGSGFCELKAGHTGAHSDGHGHWKRADQPEGHAFAHRGDCSGSVGMGTGNGLIGAQIGAEGIEGNA